MEYSQVMLEMLERIKVLENKVKVLEEKIENTPTPKPQTAMQLDKVSAKYRGLAEYLLSSNETRVTLSYSQIEEILGFALPDTARKFKQSYWANTETHSYASSWMAVGYKTRVDIDSDTVTFIKNLI
ncbi:MAG: hypothetical protein SPJ19_07300 [Candidatus Borkfalkiaceae bacterium]|nr:hypothetical protein [Christensenellaceae bacterium]